MRSKTELDSIAQRWAEELIESWQPEYGAWDGTEENEELTEKELEYLMYSVRFAVVIK